MEKSWSREMWKLIEGVMMAIAEHAEKQRTNAGI
jgi:hypothetical protein